MKHFPNPKGPKIENILKIFLWDCKLQVSHPPRPYFLWGNLKVKSEIFRQEIEGFSNEIVVFFKIRALRVNGWWGHMNQHFESTTTQTEDGFGTPGRETLLPDRTQYLGPIV